jgi:hypothetical protein
LTATRKGGNFTRRGENGMSKTQSDQNGTQNPTREGLKVLGWVVLLLAILTLAVGLPLTALPL